MRVSGKFLMHHNSNIVSRGAGRKYPNVVVVATPTFILRLSHGLHWRNFLICERLKRWCQWIYRDLRKEQCFSKYFRRLLAYTYIVCACARPWWKAFENVELLRVMNLWSGWRCVAVQVALRILLRLNRRGWNKSGTVLLLFWST